MNVAVDSKLECPVMECHQPIPAHVVMCRKHWHMVRPELARKVMRQWVDGPYGAYLTTRTEAIAMVDHQVVYGST